MLDTNSEVVLDQEIIKVLSLDGGGAKGFYTLGILREVEAAVGKKYAPFPSH